ncbi:bifunctional DNA primase/polymerase [Microbacterium sp.]|uniref:bifunctional DNA primase/polymerase n=1 Tax=Microbacterium sp. TaxID=51671 RepID=UPI0039E230D3
MSVPVGAALRLARAGWRVVPLHGKKPFLPGWMEAATTDRDTIRGWWAEQDYNVGAVIPHNHVVIDIDPHNGGSLRALEEAAGVKMPPTLSIYSGRGGGSVHLHYLRPFPKTTKVRMPTGIDVLTNAQVVMPPSIHPDTGKPYRWGAEAPVARLPLEVAALIKPRPHTPRRAGQGKDVSGLVSWLRRQPKGERHDALMFCALVLRDNNAPERHIRKVIEAAVDLGFAPEEARRVIESVRKSNA